MRKVTIHLRDEDFDEWWKWYTLYGRRNEEIEYDMSRGLIWQAATIGLVEELMEGENNDRDE